VISSCDTAAIQHFGRNRMSGISLVLGRNLFYGDITVIPLSYYILLTFEHLVIITHFICTYL